MPPDLRKHSCDDAQDRVQKALQTDFDLATQVRKRRSIGFCTSRDTWVRVEVRDLTRIGSQGWGMESGAVLTGVAKPTWFQGFSWLDAKQSIIWHADEMEYIADASIKPGGIVTTEPELPASWWDTLSASLTALAAHSTTPGSYARPQAHHRGSRHRNHSRAVPRGGHHH